MSESDATSPLSQAFAELGTAPDAELRRARAQAHRALFGEQPGEQPLTVGRYRLLANVGRGGLGEVWAAHDGQLDRMIAVKLLRDDTLRRHRRARAQLLAEAAVMARLTHPNVVRVYDVGESNNELFVAMEYVEGQTLRAWQRDQHDWRTILEVYLCAGEGLAAAHAAALVHGDFKPDNVLIGDDGRVLVSDFGVVQHLAEARAEPAVEPALRLDERELADESIPQTMLDSTVEPAPLLVGTPAYMAPEQLVGGVPDARADQFGFCVALWEALVGERPFTGSTPATLREAIAAGPREPPRSARAPAQLLALLRRGLADRPSDRYDALTSLLGQLRRLASRRRRWTITALSLSIVAVGVLGLGYGLLARPASGERHSCTLAELAIPSWPAQRERIAARLSQATPALTRERIATLLAELDGFDREWTRARAQACAMQRWLGSDASLALVQQASACLDAAAVDFAAASEVLSAAESDPVIVASPLVASLPKPGRCLASSSDRMVAGTGAPRVDRRAAIARVRALRLAQRHDEALAAADELLAEGVLGHEPAQLGALALERGMTLLRVGQHSNGLRELQRAYSLAEVADERRLALMAASGIAGAWDWFGGVVDPHALEAWSERTILLAERLGDPVKVLEGRLMLARAYRHLGEPDRALALQLDALAEAERELGPQAIELAYAHDYIGGLHAELGHVEQALAHKREAVAILERALGPDHMDLATLLSTSANVHAMLGQHEQARALYQRAMVIISDALGPEHRRARALARRYANFLYSQGEPERAEVALADDQSDEATLARARWAIVIGEIERAKQLLGSLGDPLERERDSTWSDDPWLRGELLLAHADVALAERSFVRARALAEGLRGLGEPLAFFELAALVIEAELELGKGSLTEATEQALAREIEQPGVPPARRARALQLRLQAADEGEREAARDQVFDALRTAYGPAHPYRRALEGDQP